MQIKKINNDKLKVTLDISDLDKKNIDVDSFLSNSIESQSFFFEILDLAEEKYDFTLSDNKAIIEAISLDNNVFVLTITKLKSENKTNKNTKNSVYTINNSNELLDLYDVLIKNNYNINELGYIYKYNTNYYFFINKPISKNLENIILEYSSNFYGSDFLENILVEYGNKVKF